MIRADKYKVKLEGMQSQLIAEFAMIYKSLLEEKCSKEVIMFSLKLVEENVDCIKEKRNKKKPTITKIEIDSLDISEELKNIFKKYIDIN